MKLGLSSFSPAFGSKLTNDALHVIYESRNNVPKGLSTLHVEDDAFERQQNPEAYDARHRDVFTPEEMKNRSKFYDNLKLEGAKKIVAKHVKNDDYNAILEMAGIEVELTAEGGKIISHYGQPSTRYTFKDLGVDEEKLLEGVVAVYGPASFKDSSLEKPAGIKVFYDNVVLHHSSIKDMSSVQKIKGVAFIDKDATPEDYKISPKTCSKVYNAFA